MSRFLKFEILCRGIVPSRAALDVLSSYHRGTIIVRDYPTTSGLILRIASDFFVNARIRFDSPVSFPLDHDGGTFLLHVEGDTVPVDVLPPAQYALENRRLSTGTSIITVANTHADRVRLNPIYGCAYHCDFCTFPGFYRRNTPNEMVEALRIALADRILGKPHVLVSGGTPRLEDYDYLNEVYAALPRMFADSKWDLMLTPRTLHPGPRTPRTYGNFVKRLKDWGFDALSVNLEFNSKKARRMYMPEKDEIGRDGYLTFIEHAVDCFGQGKVRSVLIVGLESGQQTLSAVGALAERGVLVELSPFWADPQTFLAREPEPTPEFLMSVYQQAMEITTHHGVPMDYFCVPCSHNIL